MFSPGFAFAQCGNSALPRRNARHPRLWRARIHNLLVSSHCDEFFLHSFIFQEIAGFFANMLNGPLTTFAKGRCAVVFIASRRA